MGDITKRNSLLALFTKNFQNFAKKLRRLSEKIFGRPSLYKSRFAGTVHSMLKKPFRSRFSDSSVFIKKGNKKAAVSGRLFLIYFSSSVYFALLPKASSTGYFSELRLTFA